MTPAELLAYANTHRGPQQGDAASPGHRAAAADQLAQALGAPD